MITTTGAERGRCCRWMRQGISILAHDLQPTLCVRRSLLSSAMLTTESTRTSCAHSSRSTAARSRDRSALIARWRAVVLGARARTTTLPNRPLSNSVPLPSARCTRRVFVPITTIGTSSTASWSLRTAERNLRRITAMLNPKFADHHA